MIFFINYHLCFNKSDQKIIKIGLCSVHFHSLVHICAIKRFFFYYWNLWKFKHKEPIDNFRLVLDGGETDFFFLLFAATTNNCCIERLSEGYNHLFSLALRISVSDHCRIDGVGRAAPSSVTIRTSAELWQIQSGRLFNWTSCSSLSSCIHFII